MTDTHETFVPIKYRVDQSGGHGGDSAEVDGFAFEVPGWPEFHACVRYGSRFSLDIFDGWIVDHFETGLAICECGNLGSKEEAPAALAKVLDERGKVKVHTVLKAQGIEL